MAAESPARDNRTNADPHEQMRQLVTRYFFSTVALTALLSGLKYALLPGPMSGVARVGLVGGFALLLVMAGVSMSVGLRRVRVALTAVSLGAIAMVVWSAVALQLGLHHPALGFLALITCLVSGVAGPRWGTAMAGVCAAAIGGLAMGEASGWLQHDTISDHMPLASQLVTHAMLLLGGLLGGLLLASVVDGYVDDSAERERRFLGLLWIAADAYWETDADCRLAALWEQRIGSHGFVRARRGLGRRPWELSQLGPDPARLVPLQAALQERRAFRNIRLQWHGREGETRHILVSGEPRFDPQGQFLGFWGVSRDATEDIRAHDALAATETRYRELFQRIQSPLVLHRNGQVIDANPAALTLFGYADLSSMRAHSILEIYEPGEMRELARQRVALLESLPVGGSLPVSEFVLQARDGRRVVVRGTGVRVEAEGGPATLSTYLDDTERKTAEDAVRRSQALLSHLVDTSPDVITLTEMATGRYEMVNDTFLNLLGYTREEVIGRTSMELDVWHDLADRDRLVRALQADGQAQNLPAEFNGKHGRRISLMVSAARFQMDGRDYLVINARDVTQIERTRKELEAILQNASIGIAFTRDQRFVQANQRCEQMFGWGRGELIGQPGSVVWPNLAEYEAIGAEIGPILAAGEAAEIERIVTRKDGSQFVCRILAKAIDPRQTRGGTAWILDDVTERRLMDQALARARDDAEAASRAKSAFLANTSHELRTPLNGLVGLTRLALQPDVDEAQRRHFLEQINDSAESLSAIINDILDLSKIEAGKLHLETLAFDLHDLLQALHRGYATLATARGLTLQMELDPSLPQHVLGDPVRVRQILSNYLSNALKFTPQGRVSLRAFAGAHGSMLRFEVEDTGPGIAPDVQERLFQPFVQADQSTTRRYGGTGLGLSICQQLATLMGGEVGVDSTPGHGSRFWVDLPLEATEVAEHRSVFGSLEAADPLQGARVLMVEDNPVNMLIAVALLEQWDVQVTQAVNGPQAIEAVEQAASRGLPFHAVLMDVQMPEMSGHEATRLLRQRHDRRELPIIALTAAALVSERDEALAAGMNDFLTKPIDAQRLRRTLSGVLLRRRARA